MRKKFLVGLLICALALSVPGCGSASAARGEHDNREEKAEPILNVFIMRTEESKAGIWQGWGAKKLYDDLNMKLNFFPTGVKTNVDLPQYLVAGQLQDFVGLKDMDYAQLIMDADMFLPLDEYQEKLPNIFQKEIYEDAVRYSRDYNSNGTGHLFIMPVAIGPANYNSFNWVPLLQWDAYKQAGMPQVHTLEDYLDVAEQMAACKPVTEKGDKVYGFSLFSEWDVVSAVEISTLSYMYGIDSSFVSPLMEANVVTKEIKSLLSEDSFYKRALRFYFEANQRGLLDPDSMSQNYIDVEEKFSEGRVLFSWFSWLHGDYNSMENQNNEQKVDGMASVVADDMKLYKAPNQTIGRQWFFAIPRNCSNIDAALEFMNWLYDPEIQRYLTSGPQGVTWDYNEAGEPEIINWEIVDRKTENLMPESVGGGSFQDGVDNLSKLGLEAQTIMEDGYALSYRYWPSTLERNPTLLKHEIREMLGGISLADYLYANDMVAESTQAVNMVPTPGRELEKSITRIGEVVKSYSWQMVYANDKEEFEKLWDIMVANAKELGLDRVTAYYTREWENALALVKDYE